MFHPIKTAPELSQAITSTYLINVVIAIVFVLIMVLAVNLIKYQTGKKDNSGSKRRVCFFIIMVVVLIACLVLYNHGSGAYSLPCLQLFCILQADICRSICHQIHSAYGSCRHCIGCSIFQHRFPAGQDGPYRHKTPVDFPEER